MNSLILLSYVFAYCSFFYGILRFKPRQKIRRSMIGTLITSAAVIIPIQIMIKDYVDAIPFAYIYAFIIVGIIYKCPLGKRITYFLHTALTFSVIQEVMGILLELFLAIPDPINTIISLFTMGIVFIVLYKAFTYKLAPNAFLLPTRFETLFLMIELLVASMSTLCLAFAQQFNHEQKLISPIISLGSLTLLVVFYCAIHYINVTKRQNTQLEDLNDYNEQQKSYYELLLSKEEQTRKFRHDIENDLLELQYYLDSEDVDKTADKISHMLKDIHGIRKKVYTVGIDFVDVILNYYLVPIQDEVKIQIKSNVVNGSLPVSNADMIKVMSNLLKNAIEATMYLPKESRLISIDFVVGRSSMCIRIENTFDVSRKNLISEGTSKEDKKNHGFGIKKIEEIVETNKGFFSSWEKNDHYFSEIIFH